MTDLLDILRLFRQQGMCLALTEPHSLSGSERCELLVQRLKDAGFDVPPYIDYPSGERVSFSQVIKDHVKDVRGCTSVEEYRSILTWPGRDGINPEFDSDHSSVL